MTNFPHELRQVVVTLQEASIAEHHHMPSDGTKMIDAGWPMEIEFTEKYPVFYLEKLLHGEDWEKDLCASRL